jgi:hypothetical protein
MKIRGEVEVELSTFLISTLKGVSCQDHTPATFPLEVTLGYSLNRGVPEPVPDTLKEIKICATTGNLTENLGA